jgi:hypothetical protein
VKEATTLNSTTMVKDWQNWVLCFPYIYSFPPSLYSWVPLVWWWSAV